MRKLTSGNKTPPLLGVWMRFAFAALLCASLLTFSGAFYFLNSNSALAATPVILNYQGRLADSGGNLLGGSGTNYNFRFSIYDASTSGTRLWPSATPSTMTVQVKDGVFNVGIGDTTASGDALTVDVFDNDPIYLQVEVFNTGTSLFEAFTPRQRIIAGGFAIRAATVDNLTITTSSDYTFNVINNSSARANLQVEGQLRVGNYSSCAAQSALGGGSLCYDTSNGNLFIFNSVSSSWVSLGGGGGGSSTLQNAYDLGNVINTTSSRDILFTLQNTATDSNFIVDIESGSTGFIDFRSAGSTAFKVQSSVITASQNFDAVAGLDVTGAAFTVGGSNFQVATTGAVTLAGPITGTSALTIQSASGNNLILIGGGSGIVNISDDASISGNATVSGIFVVSGNTTLANATASNLGITTNANIGGAFSVVGNTSLTTLSFSNATGTNLGLTGSANLGGTLSVVGSSAFTNATASNLGVTGNANISGLFSVVGTTSFTNASGSGVSNIWTSNASTTNLTIRGLTGSTQCLQVNSSGNVFGTGVACGSTSSGAPTDATYVTLTSNATLSAERLLTGSANVTIT
ncbi:hypothetical protein C4553_01030, partial [Candidatus Parcubacteria bacterium]